MAYTKQEVEKAISVLNKPSCHINHVYKTENGMDFMFFCKDLVSTFEVAIEVLEEKRKQLN